MKPVKAASWRGDRKMIALLNSFDANKPKRAPASTKATAKAKAKVVEGELADVEGGDGSSIDGSGSSTSSVHTVAVGRSHRVYSYDVDMPPSTRYA